VTLESSALAMLCEAWNGRLARLRASKLAIALSAPEPTVRVARGQNPISLAGIELTALDRLSFETSHDAADRSRNVDFPQILR
jgi:hypothetical protein